jgi:hypothetical protein
MIVFIRSDDSEQGETDQGRASLCHFLVSLSVGIRTSSLADYKQFCGQRSRHFLYDVVTVINEILAQMKAQPDREVFEVDELLLGAVDYIKNVIFECFRLFPTQLTGPSMFRT